ncbi:MAG: hypothetical protein H0U28_03785 [Nocardioidaceae bacterium]|nr:hypothetical protein [Nocardioidaceae bacterium]
MAKEKSRAGAKAFVRYYTELINYSWATGATEALRSTGSKTCDACQAAANGVESVISEGGFKRGADWHPTAVLVVPLEPANAPIINVAISVNKGQFKETRKAEARRIDPAIYHFDFYLQWRSQRWVITQIEGT